MLDEPKSLYFSFPPDKLFTGPRNRRLMCGWKIALCSVLLLLSVSFSCKDSPSASDNTKITLTFEDASCIETWLRLKVDNTTAPYSVALSRDGNTLATLNILSSDTLLIDEGLSPSTTYTYRASLTLDNNIVVQSPDAPARTMDTSSHNWVFDPPVLLGDGASSALYDVAIINDSLAYAVGEIYLRDSTGQIDPIAYSVAKWNGVEWSPKRLYFGGTSILAPIRGIFVVAPNEIWLAAGSVFRWDGVSSQAVLSFSRLTLPDPAATVEKIWGAAGLDLYGVGNAGTIVHYDGTRWTRLESGTDVDINDVWSSAGGNSRLTLATASNRYSIGERKLLRIESSGVVDTLSWSPQSRLHTVWFSSGRRIYIGGGRLYGGWPGNWMEVIDLPFYFSTRIRGTRYNNVWVVGAFGLCGHFNGVSWHSFSQVSLPNGTLEGLAVTDRIIIAVGQAGNRGAVISGVRQ